jgi:hypothetical protein
MFVILCGLPDRNKYTRHAELPRHHRRMAGRAAVTGQDAFGSQHTMYIVRLGLRAHHDHRFPGLTPFLCQISIEGDDPDDCVRRRIHAFGEPLTCPFRGIFLFRVELWVQQLGDLFRRDTHDRFLPRDQTFFCHIYGDSHGGTRGTLAIPGLEHPQFAHRARYAVHRV